MATKIVKTLKFPNNTDEFQINAVKLSGKQASDFKVVQTAKSSPAASGTDYQFIDEVSQDAQGVITATKKSVREASTSQSGLMTAAMVIKLNKIDTLTTDDIDKGSETWLFNCGTATTVVD